MAVISGIRATSQPRTAGELFKLTWLAGSWNGETRNGDKFEEHWTLPSGGAMIGMSRTIRDGKMRTFEFLRIEERPEGVFYVAHVNGKPGEDFKLSTASSTEAIFEDPTRDFPKRIAYKRTADGVHATVEGTREGKPFVLDYPMKQGSLK